MEDFLLDNDGDVLIKDTQIQMVSSSKLLAQKVKQIIGTNQGEWLLDKSEGIPFQALFQKKPDYNMIREYIQYALFQIDDKLNLSEIDFKIDKNRVLHIKFTVNGEKAVVDFEI